jgi:hypothetical protein
MERMKMIEEKMEQRQGIWGIRGNISRGWKNG